MMVGGQSIMANRKRGEAFSGDGYGTRRRMLFERARLQIECSIEHGFYCEAITLSESIIADRLESRLSYLRQQNCGFQMLGGLVKELGKEERNQLMLDTVQAVDVWRQLRNRAVHEMVKIAARGPVDDWQDKPCDWDIRTAFLKDTAHHGYELSQHIYLRVAELNPRHHDRVFPAPVRALMDVRADLDRLLTQHNAAI